MSGIHTGVKQGKRVKILFKNGEEPVIAKFIQEKGNYVFLEGYKIPKKIMRSMMIYKPIKK